MLQTQLVSEQAEITFHSMMLPIALIRTESRPVPVTFGVRKMLLGTSHRPGAPIFACSMSGVMFSTITVRVLMSAPSSGCDPGPLC